MSNSTANNTCQWQGTTAQRVVFSMAYHIVTPVHFFLGLFGHVLCLIAYRQRSKKQKAYMYQIFVTISEASEVVTYAGAVALSCWCSGRLGPGWPWFMANYFLMFFAGHIILIFCNTFITSSALFSVAMAADRVCAVIRPLKYRNANHKVRQILTIVFCLSIGVLTSIYDAFRFNVTPNGNGPGLYKLSTNTDFNGGPLATALTHLRNIIAVVCTFSLIGCNLILVHAYRSRMRKVEGMLNKTAKELRLRKDEKMLTFLSIFQCCSSAMATGAMILAHFLAYVHPTFYDCIIVFVGPVTDGITELASFIDFYVLVAVSPNFREIVIEGLNAIRKKSDNILQSINGEHGLAKVHILQNNATNLGKVTTGQNPIGLHIANIKNNIPSVHM